MASEAPTEALEVVIPAYSLPIDAPERVIKVDGRKGRGWDAPWPLDGVHGMGWGFWGPTARFAPPADELSGLVESFVPFVSLCWLSPRAAEAVAAEDGTVAARLEGDLRGTAALAARHGEHLARRDGRGAGDEAGRVAAAEAGTRRTAAAAREQSVFVPHPARLAADHAALGLVSEAELRVVLLLARREDELLVAVLADQLLVGEWHKNPRFPG